MRQDNLQGACGFLFGIHDSDIGNGVLFITCVCLNDIPNLDFSCNYLDERYYAAPFVAVPAVEEEGTKRKIRRFYDRPEVD